MKYFQYFFIAFMILSSRISTNECKKQIIEDGGAAANNNNNKNQFAQSQINNNNNNNSEGFSENYFQDVEGLTVPFIWAQRILTVSSIITCIFGTLLNSINFLVFYRMKKRNTQNIYLMALSLAEIFNIQINILVPMLRSMLDNEVDKFFEKICKINGYLVEIGLLMPVWIMVVLAGERFYCIMCPLKNVTSSPRNAKVILSILTFVIITWSLFKFHTAGVEKESTFKPTVSYKDEGKCTITNVALVNLSTILWAIVPGSLSLILNICIIRQIKISTAPNKVFYPTNRIKKVTQTTRVVLLLSFIFILSLAPTGFLIMTHMMSGGEELEAKVSVMLSIARKYALIPYELNMIISFPIYYYTIKTFRQTLKNMIVDLFKSFVAKMPFNYFLTRTDSTKIGKNMMNNPLKSLKQRSLNDHQNSNQHFCPHYHHHNHNNHNHHHSQHQRAASSSGYNKLQMNERIVFNKRKNSGAEINLNGINSNNNSNQSNNNCLSNCANNNKNMGSSNSLDSMRNNNEKRSRSNSNANCIKNLLPIDISILNDCDDHDLIDNKMKKLIGNNIGGRKSSAAAASYRSMSIISQSKQQHSNFDEDMNDVAENELQQSQQQSHEGAYNSSMEPMEASKIFSDACAAVADNLKSHTNNNADENNGQFRAKSFDSIVQFKTALNKMDNNRNNSISVNVVDLNFPNKTINSVVYDAQPSTAITKCTKFKLSNCNENSIYCSKSRKATGILHRLGKYLHFIGSSSSSSSSSLSDRASQYKHVVFFNKTSSGGGSKTTRTNSGGGSKTTRTTSFKTTTGSLATTTTTLSTIKSLNKLKNKKMPRFY